MPRSRLNVMKVTSHCSQGETANDPEGDRTDVIAEVKVKLMIKKLMRVTSHHELEESFCDKLLNKSDV